MKTSRSCVPQKSFDITAAIEYATNFDVFVRHDERDDRSAFEPDESQADTDIVTPAPAL